MKEELFKYLAQYIDITEEEANTLIAFDLIKTYKKGTLLLKEGETTDNSYFILKGCIRCYYMIDGDEKTTAFYTEQQGITPQCCITKEPSVYYLSCVETCVLLVANASTEQSFFDKFPRFESLCRVLGEKMLLDNQMAFDQYMNSTAEQRYVHLLENRADLIQRVPQYQLASYLGVKPESLSRIRRRLFKQAKS